MVSRLRRLGGLDERVLAAMERVPRHRFVDSAFAPQAYEDTALPIGHGQTISKPSVVARMLSLLFQGQHAGQAGSLGRVLEIGTGCGYQAALLACLADQVLTVERIEALHLGARGRLQDLASELRWKRTPQSRFADGQGQLSHGACFDSIVSAAGGEEIPEAWLRQLAPGGRLIAPTQQAGLGQMLTIVDHHVEHGRTEWRRSTHEGVLFVPLKSGVV
jgi:protein-L-isoaspartate(D-aspartate) O-methyltransferase